jgi:DNA-binding LacI/PurR family transcriptional regulator
MTKQKRRPTMKDVARHAGVSVSTVSYVLNDSGPVAPDRRSRVLDAVRVLDYAPNASARSLKRRSAATIGLVIPDLTNQFFATVAEGVVGAASANDVLVVLCVPQASTDAEDQYTRLLRSQRLDGAIYLTGTGTLPGAILELARFGPIVLVDEHIPGFDLPSVISDSRRGAREVASHVLEQGHKRIAVIGGPPRLWTAQQRLAGYREAVAAYGGDPDALPVLLGDYRKQSGFELAAQALTTDRPTERPTALVCANDLMAIGALEYCKSIHLRVPEDVSIVGFDDIPVSALLTPKLTTVRQPAHDMGYRATTLLFDLLDNESRTQPEEILSTTVQIRESVLPPVPDAQD